MTTPGATGGEVLTAQPRALIVTIYGLYARDTGGWFSIAALIRLMAELGVDQPAVRSAISRLKGAACWSHSAGTERSDTACRAGAARS